MIEKKGQYSYLWKSELLTKEWYRTQGKLKNGLYIYTANFKGDKDQKFR